MTRRPRRRRHPDGPGARPDRPRLHPAVAPARPAHPGSRRRLLRPGRPQGPGGHGAASRRRPGCVMTPPPSGPDSRPRSSSPIASTGWTRQLIALETQARGPRRGGVPYLEQVVALLRVPRRHGGPTTDFDDAAARIDDAAAGRGVARERLAAVGRAARDRGRPAAGRHRLAGRPLPRAAAGLFGLPDGEDLRVSLVTDQPWSGYNWFDGGCRSRVDLNTDLPVRRLGPGPRRRPRDLPRDTTWSTPGRRRTWWTARGRLESSILLINTPECLISEGLADLGVGFVAPEDGAGAKRYRDLRARWSGRRPGSGDGARGRRTIRRVDAPRACPDPRSAATPRCSATRDGRSHDEVLAYLVRVGASRRTWPPSASSSSSTRSGGRTSSSTPRARRSCSAGSGRCRRPIARLASSDCSASRSRPARSFANQPPADGSSRSSTNTTRSSPG